MSSSSSSNNRWYLGGVAGCMAVAVTHPLDLIKVHLQTQVKRNQNIISMTGNVIKNNGVLGLYNGISASMLRQATYTTARFGIYEEVSKYRQSALGVGFQVLYYTEAGFVGGLVGNPADKVNVSYRNVIHGLCQVYQKEGLRGLMSGYQMTASRGCLMTIGQAVAACFLTQPLDVIKTVVMSKKKCGILSTLTSTGKEGPTAFFKGMGPAFVRLAPHTVLTFIFLEQLKKLCS